MPTHPNPYRIDLDRNPANYTPLTPLSLLDWACLLVVIGCLQTSALRLGRILRALKERP